LPAGEFGPRPVPGRSTLDSRPSSRGSLDAACCPTSCAPGRRAVRGIRTATGPSVAALWIHARAPEVRCTSLVAPTRCAPGRRAVRGIRTATGPRSQRSGFTPELQRFAGRRLLPYELRAGTSRRPGNSDRDRSLGRSALDSRPSSRSSLDAACCPTSCAPGRRAVRGIWTATGPRSQRYTDSPPAQFARQFSQRASGLVPQPLPGIAAWCELRLHGRR